MKSLLSDRQRRSLVLASPVRAVDDAEYSSRSERQLLYIGSVLLVVLSALVISSYGFGWFLLYVGPVLSLLGPVVIIVSMAIDVRKCRRALGEHRKEAANFDAGNRL